MHDMLLIPLYNKPLPHLKCSAFVNLAEMSILTPFIQCFKTVHA